MSTERMAETVANGLAADPLFCDLPANLHLHLEEEVKSSGSSRSGGPLPPPPSRWRTRSSAMPVLGRSGAFDILIAAYSLASAFWQIANPPERISDVYAEGPEVLPPEWNIDFASALCRVLTATCIGLRSGSSRARAGRKTGLAVIRIVLISHLLREFAKHDENWLNHFCGLSPEVLDSAARLRRQMADQLARSARPFWLVRNVPSIAVGTCYPGCNGRRAGIHARR